MAKKKKKSKSLKNSSNAKIKAAYTKIKQDKQKAEARQKKTMKTQLLYTKKENARLKKKKKSAIKNASGIFGAFGTTIKFKVANSHNKLKMLVPDEVQREVHGRWTSYNLLGRKPLKSFDGPDSASLTIPITLSSQHGINPKTTLEKIRKAIEKGTVNYLVIGGKTVGGVRYYIESMSETWERFFKGGKLIQASCELHFVEYH